VAAAHWGSAEKAGCTANQHFLETQRSAYLLAIARATKWLEALPVDPVALRREGQKGKKHFVEALGAYWRLYRVANAADKPDILARATQLAAITGDDAYHDMLSNDDKAFKQDATSYLRAALLMEHLGLDTTRYREEIRKIEPRLNAQMKHRGVHQRMVFAWYYRHFGLKEPFPLAESFAGGFISRRVPASTMTRLDIYDLTHEVFAPYEYGDKLDASPFTEAERRYLLETLPVLVEQAISKGDPDLVAELVDCLRQVRLTFVPEFRHGLQFLLESQRADGAWGRYEQYRERLGDLVDQAYVLHTTMVAIDALTVSFHEEWQASSCSPLARGPTETRLDAGAAPAVREDEESR
jgi:hypothetical protein